MIINGTYDPNSIFFFEIENKLNELNIIIFNRIKNPTLIVKC